MARNDRRGPPLRVVQSEPRAIAGIEPPNDVQREQVILGCCLLDPQAIHRVCDLLLAEDFWAGSHKRIFAVMLTMAGDGIAIDPVGVAAALDARDELQRAGGRAYLLELMNMPTAIATLEQHARGVAEMGVMRRWIAAAQHAVAEAYHALPVAGPLWRDQQLARLTTIAQQGAPGGSVSASVGARRVSAKLQALRPGEITGLSTGFLELDRLTGGFRAPQVYLLGGESGGGKSALSHCLAMNVASTPTLCETGERCGSGVAIFSAEMDEDEVYERMSYARGRVDSKRITTGIATNEDFSRTYEALSWIDTLPLEVEPEKQLTPLKLRGKLRAMRAKLERAGAMLRLVIVDYVQLMDVDGEPDPDKREQELSRIGKSIKLTAELFGVPIVVLTQLNNEGTPRDSKSLLMHAQNFWVIEWTAKKNVKVPGAGQGPYDACIHVKKARHGATGRAPTFFHKRFTLFSDEGS